VAGTAAGIVTAIVALLAATLPLLGCVTKDDAKKLVQALEASQPTRPDVLPVMINRTIPVRYPPALYGRKAQGNVTLRVFIDSTGRLHPESTVVATSSGEAAFDSAAVAGVRDLRFVPAARHGIPMAISILFPIYFRHPQAPPVPGDSALRGTPDSGAAHQPAGASSGRDGKGTDSSGR